MKNSVVLLSSGLDSTVNLYQAHNEQKVVLALSLNYGQKAFNKEAERSALICKELDIPHKILDISWLSDISNSSLTDKGITIPQGKDVQINDLETSKETAKSVWVCNRNGIFLNIAAAYAESLNADYIIPGFNKEEAATFPDNSLDFLNTSSQALSFSTANKVEVFCYTTEMDKTQIVKLGKELNVNFDLIWPCYHDGEQICGQCESCKRYLNAHQEGES